MIPIHISFRNYHQETSNIILVTHGPFQVNFDWDVTESGDVQVNELLTL